MQTEKQLDKRQQRSRKLLGEAIISLILEQGYENITIKSITERADVAYVTFFRHFESIDHLLSWVLEESINALVQMHEQSLNDETRSAPECFIQEGLLIFEHVAQHADLYRILFTSPGALAVLKRTKTHVSKLAIEDFQRWIDGTPLVYEILAMSYVNNLFGLIEWWLEHDMQPDITTMAQIYTQISLAIRQSDTPHL